jgi:uncharacterized membrane protein
MASLREAAAWGGAGSILVIIGSFNEGLVTITGFILIAIASEHIANLTDDAVRGDMIRAVVLFILGLLILSFTVFSPLLTVLGLGGPSSLLPSFPQAFTEEFWIGLGVSWVFFLIGALFLRRSYQLIAARLYVDTFETAGNLFLVGAATLIILIGFIILFVAEILQLVAFFSIPDKVPAGPRPGPHRGTPLMTDALEESSSADNNTSWNHSFQH